MSTDENSLILSLPRADRKRLMDQCEPLDMVLSSVLGEPHEQIQHVHFPVDGFASLVMQLDQHPGLEVGMVGREGMLGAELALETYAVPWRTVVQGSGRGWSIPSMLFQQQLVDSPALQRTCRRYLAFRAGTLAVSAACERFHPLAARLARWLLMSQDRAHTDTFHITHEFMAYMLGVRREGVSLAAADLQRRDLIMYHRGQITVRDRATLEAEACSCYLANGLAYTAHLH